MFNEEKDYRKKNLIMVIIVFTAMAGMIILDIVSKWRNSVKWLNENHKRNVQNDFDKLPKNAMHMH